MTARTLTLGAFAALLLGAALGCGAGALPDKCEAPAVVVNCQTEDACTADYHDGVWHIVPLRHGTTP